MMRGVTVAVKHPVAGSAGVLGNPAKAWADPVYVDDVLVSAGDAADSRESNRPDGVTVAYTCVWPKSDHSSLRGCLVQVPGDDGWHAVVGDPKWTPDGQMARPFRDRDRIVRIGREDG